MKKNSDKQLIVIAGPTAVGKTSLSIEIANLLQTEIVSSDSRQFYRELKIGAAPPSSSDLRKVTHHFIGHLSIHDYYNVSKYETEAIKKLDQLFNKYDNVILTGGSGLYINAILYGIDNLPDPDETVRNKLKDMLASEGIDSLQALLIKLDPEYSKIIDLKNPARLLRALEVCITSGMKFSELRKNEIQKRNFRQLFIGINRERYELLEIIKKRTNNMISQGLAEEASELYPFRHLNALNTVGYTEMFDYIEGKVSFMECIENINVNTRKYAKRQLTWFRKNEGVKWFHPDDKEKIIEYIHKSRS